MLQVDLMRWAEIPGSSFWKKNFPFVLASLSMTG